jgi:hypothetical protein
LAQGQPPQRQYALPMQPPAPGMPPQPGRPPREPWQQAGQRYGQQGASGGHPPQTGYGAAPHPSHQPFPPRDPRQQSYGPAGHGAPYGPPSYPHGGPGHPGGGPSSQQIANWITLGVIALLGLLGAILTVTVWADISSAVGSVSDVCGDLDDQFSDLCRETVADYAPGVPAALVIYLILLILGGLAAVVGAVLMLRNKHIGQFVIIGAGAVMLLFGIVSSAHYGAVGRITFDLIAGLLILTAGVLMLLPQIRHFLGLPPMPHSGRGPGPFGGGPPPYGPPPPGQYGPPGHGGYPQRQW